MTNSFQVNGFEIPVIIVYDKTPTGNVKFVTIKSDECSFPKFLQTLPEISVTVTPNDSQEDIYASALSLFERQARRMLVEFGFISGR